MSELKQPLVVGIPGFIAVDERSRAGELFRRLESEQGFETLDFRYSGFVREEQTLIRCDFNLERYVGELSSAIEGKISQGGIDTSKIGYFASSVGAGFLAHYFSGKNFRAPRAVVSVSPLVAWQYFANENGRNMFEENPVLQPQGDSELGTGVKRIFTGESVSELKKVNGIVLLRETSFDRRVPFVNVMTIYGKDDRVSTLASMIGFHIALGGHQEQNRLVLDYGHEIPRVETTREGYDFFTRALRI